MLRTYRVQASTENFVQKAVIFASVVAFVAFIFGVLAPRYIWAGYITGGLAFLAVSLGLSSLLGVKRFRDFIVSCGALVR
jgi:ABC-type multidrug transport system permease subunit